jgi:hypothetical protein
MGLVLGGLWLARGRRGGPAAGAHVQRPAAPAGGVRLGMLCAALLAVFAVGAAAGAIFATHATSEERASEGDGSGVSLLPTSSASLPGAETAQAMRADDAGVADQRRPRRSQRRP